MPRLIVKSAALDPFICFEFWVDPGVNPAMTILRLTATSMEYGAGLNWSPDTSCFKAWLELLFQQGSTFCKHTTALPRRHCRAVHRIEQNVLKDSFTPCRTMSADYAGSSLFSFPVLNQLHFKPISERVRWHLGA